jgi:hypothetical protein
MNRIGRGRAIVSGITRALTPFSWGYVRRSRSDTTSIAACADATLTPGARRAATRKYRFDRSVNRSRSTFSRELMNPRGTYPSTARP